ncbi:uncharacterized protein B0H18DRAFT_35208 [Fomitopsis serialis]|uniref:uncharacterized protein n=1 Tax=Fomitopsis serialis TaxID=139415 RepID=UPI002007C2B8|nr:uncharacterized protein B0H18DRAFT_35208 [Neoantrodia serialis]KAH9917491.1 hypothetical protein B0H18DRAFT_35208 [Neoantrodia serialis]
MAPLPRLHRSFIPDMNVTWKPPVMYYGWSIGDLQPKLLQYAEEHDLLSHTVMEGISKAVTPSGANTSDSDDSDDEGELGSVHPTNEEEEMEGEVCVDVANSAQNALWAIVEEAGVRVRHFQPYTRPFRLRGVLHEPHHVAISIYSNYELDQAVPDDDIAKVQKVLDIKEVPAWYVSNMASEWSPFPPRL